MLIIHMAPPTQLLTEEFRHALTMETPQQTSAANYQIMSKLLHAMELPTYKTVHLQFTYNYVLANHSIHSIID